MITSKANSQIKKAKALLRRSGREKWGQFLVEGVRLTEEAVGCAAVEVLYYTAKLLDTVRGEELLTAARARGIPIVECSEQVLAEMSDTVTPQGVVAVVNKPAWDFAPTGLIAVADELQDPGNLGTLFRTALAAGAAGLVLTPGCADPYNSKVVRASMGAVLKLPHWEMGVEEIAGMAEAAVFQLVVADLVDSQDYFAVRFAPNVALVIGNEAHGPSARLREKAHVRVKIPLFGPMESLNASVAAGILLYEVARQHRYG
ncbi:MAG: RNA methyltransferase [Firmicutes bacterium]|nr:RNA methyltransferase [Bacillota bacterium]